ncbi:hypothetical protein BK665_13695 [Pseudomonas frederiksbergensis]|uniref:Uncharacterized protein n=2 Tax=Pseudomonas frederiksbergensis TaxID=104087 RepID=A0A423KKP0_9PSED|nr:hypothetical protein BK665_13695 [Pseudomonas frederiksbergensis]
MFSRLNTLWSWLFYAMSWLVVLVLILHHAFYDWLLMEPVDVGGTFMGGGMAIQLYLIGWTVATLGMIVALLLRLPGAMFGWIGAGLVPLGIGAWWQLNYPDNAEEVIYSISRQGIGTFMLIGAMLLGSGLYARARRKTRALDREHMPVQFIVALMLAAFFIGVPLAIYKQQTMPHCAFSKEGQQLTVCLGDDDSERVIVD